MCISKYLVSGGRGIESRGANYLHAMMRIRRSWFLVRNTLGSGDDLRKALHNSF